MELTELEVTVTSESDFRGVIWSDASAPPGPQSVLVRIRVAAEGVGDARLRDLVLAAEAHSPVRDAIAREVPVTTEIVTG